MRMVLVSMSSSMADAFNSTNDEAKDLYIDKCLMEEHVMQPESEGVSVVASVTPALASTITMKM